MSRDFSLDHRLDRDTILITSWPVNQVRLMDDCRFPWLVLVPERANMREPGDLCGNDQALLWSETLRASRALAAVTAAEKMNLGQLGNVVPQLHVHVVARFSGDAAWPGPVWGHGTREPYARGARGRLIERLRAEFARAGD